MNIKLRELRRKVDNMASIKNKRYVQLKAKDGLFLIDLVNKGECIGNKKTPIKELSSKYNIINCENELSESLLLVGMDSENITVIVNDIL